MQMVSRYIVVKSREQTRSQQHGGPRSLSPTKAPRSSPSHRHGGQASMGTGADKSSSIADRIISPPPSSTTVNLATATATATAPSVKQNLRYSQHYQHQHQQQQRPGPSGGTGTGGTALIPFLKQARDETADGAVGDWFRRMMRGRSSGGGRNAYGGKDVYGGGKHEGKMGKGVREEAEQEQDEEGGVQVVGLNGVWRMDDCEGGICHW